MINNYGPGNKNVIVGYVNRVSSYIQVNLLIHYGGLKKKPI